MRWEACTDSTLFNDKWIFPIFESFQFFQSEWLDISKETSWSVQSFFAFESFSFLLAIFASSLLSCLWPSFYLVFCCTPKNVWNTLHMFCTQHNDEKPNVGWNCTQMHPTWKSGWMNQKILDEKFDRDQRSSNIV